MVASRSWRPRQATEERPEDAMAQAEKRECTSSGRAAATPHASAPPQLTGYANKRAGAAKTAEALLPLLRRRRYTSNGQPVAASMTAFAEPKKRAATAARVGAHGASAGDEDLQLPRRLRQRVSAGGENLAAESRLWQSRPGLRAARRQRRAPSRRFYRSGRATDSGSGCWRLHALFPIGACRAGWQCCR